MSTTAVLYPTMPDSLEIVRSALLADPVIAAAIGTQVAVEVPVTWTPPYVRLELIAQTVVAKARLASAEIQANVIGVGHVYMMSLALEVQRALADCENHLGVTGRSGGVAVGSAIIPLATDQLYDEASERLVGYAVTATVMVRTE